MKPPPDAAAAVVHVTSDAAPNAYLRTMIRAGQIDSRAIIVGSVGEAGPLQQDMDSLGVRTFALGARSRAGFPLAILRLAMILRRSRARVVQSHLLDGSLVGLSAARMAGVPAVIFTSHHSHELPYHGRKLVLADQACAGALSDHVIAPSRQVAETLSLYAGVLPSKISVVHHGFDLSRLDPSRVHGQKIRDEFHLGDALVFGAIGRIYKLKNYEALIRAFMASRDVPPDSRLLIVGPGDQRSLRQLVTSLNGDPRILLLGQRADIPELLSAFDAFIHPALAESFGMVIIEAMAMAKPVVSTPVGIAPEVLSTGRTGVLAEATDVSAIGNGISTLMALRERWPALGGAGRARVSAFTAKAMADTHADLYATLLAESATSAVRVRSVLGRSRSR